MECIDSAIEIAPCNWVFWSQKAMILTDMNDWKEALRVCEKAEVFGAQEGETFGDQKTEILYNLGMYEEALEASHTVIDPKWRGPRFWNMRAAILEKLGHTLEAEEAKQMASQLRSEGFRG